MNKSLLSFFILFFILQSCHKESETLDGKWVTKDIQFKIDLSCDCTEEEKAEIKNIINGNIQNNLDQMKPTSYLNFKPDFTVTGAFFGDEVTGTYEATHGEVYLTLEDYKDVEKAQVVRIGEDNLLKMSTTEATLNRLADTTNHPKIGEVKMTFTKLDLILEENKKIN